MYYLTFDGYNYKSSDGEGFVQDDDGPSASPRKLLVRAEHFEEDLAALWEALARASADTAEQREDIAKLTFRGSFLGISSGIELLNHRISFGRFVDLLEQSMRPGHAPLRTFKIEESYFDSSDLGDYHREEDLERLFRDVLPHHPTIERIQLGQCEHLSRYASLLVSSVPSTRATSLLDLTLELHSREDPTRFVEAVGDMLRRDVPLRALSLVAPLLFDGDPADCGPIFRSLAANTRLQGLAIHDETVTDGAFGADDASLCLAFNAAPALRALHVQVRFAPGGVESVARQLRTNTTLVELRLWVRDLREFEALVRAVERVLATYNFTIRSLRLEPPLFAQDCPNELASIAASLRRNERIRQALEQLPTYRVAPIAPLPRVLEMVSDLPTLLFRFLRKSDINVLFDHLLQVEVRKRGGGSNKRIRTA
jgi:hypothetical protein